MAIVISKNGAIKISAHIQSRQDKYAESSKNSLIVQKSPPF
jgi:hypothetical protein